jgi:hypothetical protein
MPALIQSQVIAPTPKPPVVGASRDDLRAGDTVQLDHVGPPATTYAWSIAFKPEDKDRNPSSATLLGNVFGPGPVTFDVDNEGPYLIRLVIDAGLPTQDEQYVRLRYDTFFGDLKLVAAGERRDGTGVVPVDVSAEGWANDQNFNLNRLLCLVQHVSSSGRIVYVDANRGKDNLNPQDDPSIAEGYADFSTINAAILAAETNSDFNGGIPPSATQPVIVAVRPGFYQEDVEFKPYVHVIGWPSTGGGTGDHPDFDRSVTIRCENLGVAPTLGTHTANLPNLGEYCMIANVILENVGATTNALIRKIGEGDVYLLNSELLQTGGAVVNQGASISVDWGQAFLHNCRVVQEDTFDGDSLTFLVQSGPGLFARLEARESTFIGPSLGKVDENLEGANTAAFSHCKFEQTGIDPGSFSIQSWAEDILFEDCELTVESPTISDAIEANPTSTGAANDLQVRIRRSVFGDTTAAPPTYLGININPTTVPGTSTIQLGSSEYGTLTAPLPVVRQALTIGTSLFYDNTVVGLLVSSNVQDAIDELAGGGGGGAAPSGAEFVTYSLAAGLTNQRVLSNGTGTVINTSVPGAISVDLDVTGVGAGSYTRTDLTVNSQGQITSAADGVIEYTYSLPIVVPTVGAFPLTINEFAAINFPENGFNIAPGAVGPIQIYYDTPVVLGPPGTYFLDILIAYPPIPPLVPVSILPAPIDLATLGAGPVVLTPVTAGAITSAPPGSVLIVSITWPVAAPPGADGLVVGVTGTI